LEIEIERERTKDARQRERDCQIERLERKERYRCMYNEKYQEGGGRKKVSKKNCFPIRLL